MAGKAKLAVHHKGGKHHNMTRQAHNKDTHKYEKQVIRTDVNKARHIKKAEKLKKASEDAWLIKHPIVDFSA